MLKIKLFLVALLILICNSNVEAKDVQPLFGIYKIISNDSDELLNQSYTQIFMTDDAEKIYPQLGNAIKNYTADLKSKAQLRSQKYHKEAKGFKEEAKEHFRPFYDKTDIIIRRADSNVLSLMGVCEDYFGGVHGMYGYFGVNFDSTTGKQLKISDICTDKNQLLNAILMRLHEDYPRSPFENAKENISKWIAEDKLNFTIEPAGVSFHFNPYEIGSYAEGLFTATLLFNEYPNLFNKKIQQLPQSYCQTLPLYHSNIVSFKNGMRNFINITTDDREYCKILTGAGIAQDQSGLKGIKSAVLVHLANGNNYLYIDGYLDDKGRRLHIYRIDDNKIELVSVLPYSFKNLTGASKFETWYIPTNPNKIQFDSIAMIKNSYTHYGVINSDGSFSLY